MRWQYTTPAGKLFVSDGKYIYLYTPGTQRVERSKVKETDDMRAPLAFLWANSISSGFQALCQPAARSGFPDRRRTAVGRAPFSQVEFRWAGLRDPRTRDHGQDNSVMQFRFQDEKLNPPLSEALFRFEAPAGAETVEEMP